MPKYKSSAAYRAADTLNKQLKSVYGAFGESSEVYQLYVNRLTAALPPGTLHVSDSGVLQVSKGKSSGLTAQKIKAAKRGLPSVKQAKQTYKRQIAEEWLSVEGKEADEVSIQRTAKGVSDQDIQKFVDAKSYVKDRQEAEGKLKYDASVAELMGVKGAKSYELLAAILQEGEKRSNAEAQKEAVNVATVEGGYKNGKAQLED